MSIVLPKRLKGYSYDGVVPFEMNDAELDSVLTLIFIRVVLEGRSIARYNQDPTDFDTPLRLLAHHPRLNGFGDEADVHILDRLVRATLITVGYKGQRRRPADRQIDGIAPYTLGSFKPGFPKQANRARRIDQFVYLGLVEQAEGDTKKVLDLFRAIFGKGLDVRFGLQPQVERLPDAELDVIADLSLAYLDGLEPITVAANRNILGKTLPTPLPGVHAAIGRDLWRYLQVYGSRLPVSALARQYTALISFELFVLTVKLFEALPQLVREPSNVPTAMRRGDARETGPDLFLDFAGQSVGPNRLMANACLRRDMEAIDDFVRAMQRLRYLDGLVSNRRSGKLGSIIEQEIGPEGAARDPKYLQGLLRLASNPHVAVALDATAALDLDEIRQVNAHVVPGESLDEGQSSETISRINSLIEPGIGEFEQVANVLFAANRKNASQNAARWFSSLGGLGKDFGLIRGTSNSRQSWRYSPSSELLGVLVNLAAIDHRGWHPVTNPDPQPIGLSEFLDWLRLRFGVLVGEPPSDLGFDGPEYAAAARENLQAMLRRLRQMGHFTDLADDFSVQRLVPSMGEAEGNQP